MGKSLIETQSSCTHTHTHTHKFVINKTVIIMDSITHSNFSFIFPGDFVRNNFTIIVTMFFSTYPNDIY